MKNYYKIMLGKKSTYADECLNGNFIGADYGIHVDLKKHSNDDLREFNHQFIPVYLDGHPGKTKIAAGLACGALWTISFGMKSGDIVLCPNGHGVFMIGEITGDYEYAPGGILPHRRRVIWKSESIKRTEVSAELRSSTLSQGTTAIITQHAEEIERYISGKDINGLNFESPVEFALEKHLEEFLVKNWSYTELGKHYDIYEEEGEIIGQQFQSDTGPLDILAISKDKKTLLVVELKKGRASDSVVGQIQRYMGYVLEELAEEGQGVKGVIIALEDDVRIRRALSVTNNIEFYRYQIDFRLVKS